ncbi:hypothetical protein A2U01_0089086, partial [Trifolium medium]|nr:hypothetical protein [Trifolium medium]
YQEDESNAQE